MKRREEFMFTSQTPKSSGGRFQCHYFPARKW